MRTMAGAMKGSFDVSSGKGHARFAFSRWRAMCIDGRFFLKKLCYKWSRSGDSLSGMSPGRVPLVQRRGFSRNRVSIR